MIYILFGEMGIGKNYVGERLASRLKCKFIDGDDFLTPAMQKKVNAFKPLSKQDLDEFMEKLVEGIAINYDGEDDIVVAQALYRREHRAWIYKNLNSLGHKVDFIWIPVPSVRTHIKRLWSRNFKWVLYGMFNKLFFQRPYGGGLIHNRDKGNLEEEFKAYFLLTSLI